MGDTQEKVENKLQYQTKKMRALKTNLQNVLTEILKLLLNSGENNNAVPIFK